MKATELLKKQHRVVEAIFKKLEDGKGDAQALVQELSNNLSSHMAIEQNIFYPAVKSVKKDLVAEGYEEHSVAELALKRLRATKSSAPSFKAKVTCLKELIEHHVEEEEEEMFPAVEKKLGAERLNALGEEMEEAFELAMSEGFEALVPKTMTKTSADVSKRKGNTAAQTHAA